MSYVTFLTPFSWCNPWGTHRMVCNMGGHLPGNHELMWHPARLIKEGACVDLSMYTLHLKNPLVLFVSEDSTLNLPLFPLSPRMIMLRHCSSIMTKNHFLVISYGSKWYWCFDVPLNTYSFIHPSWCVLYEIIGVNQHFFIIDKGLIVHVYVVLCYKLINN